MLLHQQKFEKRQNGELLQFLRITLYKEEKKHQERFGNF